MKDHISILQGYIDHLEFMKKNAYGFFDREQANKDIEAFKAAIKALEQEPKTGHWKYYQNDKGDWVNECSVCGSDTGVGYQYPFCPNCGAKMVAPQEREDKECR